jgi:hypothetical protein
VTDQRTDVPKGGGERELLRAYLDFHRETLALTCGGPSDVDLAPAHHARPRRRPSTSPASTVGRATSTRCAGSCCT